MKYSHHLKISISFSDRTASAANMQSKLNKECLIRSVQKITNCSLESVQFSLDQKNQIWSSFALMKFYGKSLINNTFMLNCAFTLLLGVNKADCLFSVVTKEGNVTT